MMKKEINRKEFVQAGAAIATGLLLSSAGFTVNTIRQPIKAIAFDAFPILDPRPVFKAVSELLPEKGKLVVDVWQSKQFSYQWLRLLGRHYKNFWEVSKEALDVALAQQGIALSDKDKEAIMNKYEIIGAWPDVIPVLEFFRNEKFKICFLSNMTSKMLQQGARNANIEQFFDYIISTDERQTYKPHPAAYQLGIDTLGLRREEILFVAFAGWDMAGAKWFGYPTFWVNRLNAPMDKLDVLPDGEGNNLNDLASFVKNSLQ